MVWIWKLGADVGELVFIGPLQNLRRALWGFFWPKIACLPQKIFLHLVVKAVAPRMVLAG